LGTKKSGKGRERLEFFPPVKGQQDLRKVYPELENHIEFRDLHFRDLLFVWRYVISYSSTTDDNERAEKAVASSYLNDGVKDNLKKRLLKLDFPVEIERAIKKMETFDLPARLMARSMTEKIFMSYQSILGMADGDRIKMAFINPEDKSIDWGKISQFVNATVKMNESLPMLIAKMEDGYGFKSKKKKTKKNDDSLNIESIS